MKENIKVIKRMRNEIVETNKNISPNVLYPFILE